MMNPAITAALIAASHNKESDEHISGKLREAKALGASVAITLDLDEKQQKLLDKAIASGTIVRTLDGRFYLDERAVSDRKEAHGFRAVLILLVIASIFVSIAVLLASASG